MMENQEKAPPSTSESESLVDRVPGDEEEDDDDVLSFGASEFSVSIYSDDDSAVLFAEDSRAEVAKQMRMEKRREEEEGDEDWMDDEIRQSSQLIYGIMVLLCLSSIIVAVTTTYYANSEADKEYELAFADVAKDIFDVSKGRSDNAASIIRSVSRTMTTAAGSQTDWPFFTMENMNIIAGDFLAFGDSVELVYAPIVSEEQHGKWDTYSVDMQEKVKNTTSYSYQIPEFIYGRHVNETIHINGTTGPQLPAWQILPQPSNFLDTAHVNYNLLSNQYLAPLVQAAYESKHLVRSQIGYEGEFYGEGILADPIGEKRHPQSLQVQPVFQNIEDGSSSMIVGYIFAKQPWDYFLRDIVLPNGTASVFCVVQDTCIDSGYTYYLDGKAVSYLGGGDRHIAKYENIGEQSTLASYSYPDNNSGNGFVENSNNMRHCELTLSIYPSGAMRWKFKSGKSATNLLALVIFVFILVSIAIVTHHRVTDVHQRETQAQATRSKAIIASLFPEAIRERLFDVEGEVNVDTLGLFNTEVQKAVTNDKEKNEMQDLWGKGDKYADHYQACTVCIGDIVGFSAWASLRDPDEIFTLLEAAFSAFDRIAKLRGAYKVDTSGDSYLAVAGLPTPRKDHAIVMARFARDALDEFIDITNKLEVTLGPDTSDGLGLRFGLASGPALAGIIRGERARFQVYGDTVSKCSRMEQSGQSDRIHVSKETAELIKAGGQWSWIRTRQSIATRKGEAETYWVLPKRASKKGGGTLSFSNSIAMMDFSAQSCMSKSAFDHSLKPESSSFLDYSRRSPRIRTSTILASPHNLGSPHNAGSLLDFSTVSYQSRRKTKRSAHLTPGRGSLILNPNKDGLVDSTSEHTTQTRPSITRRRKRKSSLMMVPQSRQSQSDIDKVERLIFWNSQTLLHVLRRIVAKRQASKKEPLSRDEMSELESQIGETKSVMRELRKPVTSGFGLNVRKDDAEAEIVDLGDHVESQLIEYVKTIASLNKITNPYSNFLHASHATMGMQKLLARLVDPGVVDSQLGRHRVNSDPLMQFALLLCAMISDTDHKGISNHDLGKEHIFLAELYDHQSVSEQNALDMAWRALMDPEFEDLRRCIYADEKELREFRSVLVHGVLATDMTDKSLNKIIQRRWEKAFNSSVPKEAVHEDEAAIVSRKATAVVEHLMQAAEVSHAMQHWHVYCKWSQLLFVEAYTSFQTKRTDMDPSVGWYRKELAYFDQQVVPLAKKLKSSGLLGSSGDMYLQNALQNREDWARKGEDLVAGLMLEVE